jgi:hypothetical protein
MKKYIKKVSLSLGVLGCLFASENGNAANLISEDRVFGASESHIKLGRGDTTDRSTLTIMAGDQAGENDLARMLNSLIAAGLIGRLEVRMEVPDINRLSSTANDSFVDGEHKQAFYCYGILVALNSKDHIAKYHLANYLIQGIRESLHPKEQDRFRACQLLIEASWLEMTEHPDEPDNGGRLVRAYESEVYNTLSKLVTNHQTLIETVKENLQAQLFAKVKDLPSDPF